jgi:hypothetical protein
MVAGALIENCDEFSENQCTNILAFFSVSDGLFMPYRSLAFADTGVLLEKLRPSTAETMRYGHSRHSSL